MFAYPEDQFFTRFGIVRSGLDHATVGLVSSFNPVWAPSTLAPQAATFETAQPGTFLSRFFGASAFAQVAPIEPSGWAALRTPELPPALVLPALPPLTPLPSLPSFDPPVERPQALSPLLPSGDDAPPPSFHDARTPNDGLGPLTSADDGYAPTSFSGLVRDGGDPPGAPGANVDDTPGPAFGQARIPEDGPSTLSSADDLHSPTHFGGHARDGDDRQAALDPGFDAQPFGGTIDLGQIRGPDDLQFASGLRLQPEAALFDDATSVTIFAPDAPLTWDASAPIDWSGLVDPGQGQTDAGVDLMLLLQNSNVSGTIDLSARLEPALTDSDFQGRTPAHMF
jgi:hypothetical protein